MKFLSSEKLSEHKYKTPEGYLVCVDAILARTGTQEYRKNEVFADSDDDSIIKVDRRPEEVFSAETLASFENKPITVEHPDENVNTENYKDYSVGFVRDVKRGVIDGQEVMLGTLVITDEQTIEEIENGEHVELSCGYDCDIVDEENPQQRNIRGNHVALCEQGRAGIARIVDSNTLDDYQSKEVSGERIENMPQFARNYMRSVSNKKSGLIAIENGLDDIINAAEPSMRKELRIKADKIIKDLKAQFDIKDSSNKYKDSLTELDLDVIDDAIRYVKLSHKPLTIENIIYQLNLDVQGFIGNNMSNIIKYLKEVKHIRDSIVRDVNPHEGENFIEETKDDAPEPTKEMIAFIKNHSDIEEKVNQMLRQGIGFNEAVNYAYIEGKKKYKDSIKDVEPHEGEDKADFISRFMEETKEEYPDAKQRLAVAYNYWEKRNIKDAISYNEIRKFIKKYYPNDYAFNYKKEHIKLENDIDRYFGEQINRDLLWNVLRGLNSDGYLCFINDSIKDEIQSLNVYNRAGDLLYSKKFSSRSEMDRYIQTLNVYDMTGEKDIYKNNRGNLGLQNSWKVIVNDSTKKFQIYYKDNGKTYINIVKAKSLDDAIKTHLKRSK